MGLFDDTRAAWGARDATSVKHVAITRRTEFFSHWNGGPTGLTVKSPHSACLALVKRIQNDHMDRQDWSDVGYNALCCPHARLIEGRGRDYAGAHCPDHNTSGIGVQFMLGKGETASPAMFARVARFKAECDTAAGHHLVEMGHRDGFSTECPGDQIEDWVIAGMPTTNTVQEDDMFTDADRALLKAIEAKLTAHDAEEDARYGSEATISAARYAEFQSRLASLQAAALKTGGDLTAEDIAAAIPATIAQSVVDALAARLSKPQES